MLELRGSGPIARSAAVFTILALTAILFPVLATPAGAADPDHVTFTLEGCDQDGSFTLPNLVGNFICPDARYGTGNLGKNWNELDLVPFRLTADAGNAAPAVQTYTVGIAVDNKKVGKPGYDVLSAPVFNVAESSLIGCGSLVAGADSILTPGFGGVDESRYRKLTISNQAANTTCVYDFYARLALGSHLFPGSSLHANLTDEALETTNQDRSIPVNEIQPQGLRKDMTATQGTDHIWDISKDATPAELNFRDTCGIGDGSRSAPVSVTVRWEKRAATASGPITVITHVYAKNPASRAIAVNVSDDIRSGTTVLDTASSGLVDIPANTEALVLTHLTTVPAGTTNLNDVATATYTDRVTLVPIPGTTTATASATVQPSGTDSNSTATITDIQSITGAHLEFSVDSVTGSGAPGSFTGGYLLGAHRTAATPLTWTSAPQSGNGSVTFNKTVYVTEPTITSGSLSDTATLTGSDGFTASASASTSIVATAAVSLTVNKTIPDVLQGLETQTFNFSIWAKGSDPTQDLPAVTASITFTAGETTRSTTVSGLLPGVYFVTEDPAAGWNVQPPSGEVDLGAQSDGSLACSGSVRFDNSFGSAAARAIKVTAPAGQENGWTMCLQGPGTGGLPGGKECVVTANGGVAPFTTPLQEGDYTVAEVLQAGWRQSGTSGCSFTVDYPADKNRVFTCTVSNEQLGRIIVKKLTDPPNETQLFAFTLVGGPSALNQSFSLTHDQTQDSGHVQAGAGYAAAETVPAGWDQSSASCDDGSPVGNIDVSPGETVTCTFANTKRGLIIIKKVTDPTSSNQAFGFTLVGGPSVLNDSFSLTSGGSRPSAFVKPGSGYVAAETVPAGWDQTSATCDDDNSSVGNINVSPGEIVTCTFSNTQRGLIVIKKVTVPTPSAQSFSFGLNGGPSTLSESFSLTDGGSHQSASVKPGSGYLAAETVPAGWDQTSATCDDNSPVSNIDVAPGETVTCTFTNTQRGQIIIKKVTDPPLSTQPFAFTLGGGPSALSDSFSLTGGGSRESGFVLPGSGYAAAETVPDGWKQTSATCDDDDSVVSDIDVSPGETVTCTFTNEQLGRIIIEKLTDPSEASQSFDFTLEGGTSELEQSFSLIDGGSHDSGYVQAGSGYAATETVPDGWDQSSASCDDSSPVANIDVAPGETVTCTFANTQRGLIIIKKMTVPAPATQSFDFTLGGGPSELSQAFSLTGGGTHESGFVKPGSGYAATETVPADWNQTSATCDDGSPVGNINVSPAEIVTCTFTNTAKPNGITLDKKVNGGDHATLDDAFLAHSLDALTYTVVITNNGQVPLTITALSDSLYAGLVDACPQGVGSVLAPGASFTCTYQVSAGGDAHNVAAVSAVDSINRPVSDSDETFVDVIHPAITIDKTADPASVSVSGPVTYTYVITNTGDTVLDDIVVTDDILGDIGTVDSLDPGESKTLTKTVVVDAETPPINVGTVTGTDVLGKTVSDDDDAAISVVLPLVVAVVLPLTATPPGVIAQPAPVTIPLAAAELPRTGSPIGAEARLGFILLQAGLALEILSRRRRKLHSQAG